MAVAAWVAALGDRPDHCPAAPLVRAADDHPAPQAPPSLSVAAGRLAIPLHRTGHQPAAENLTGVDVDAVVTAGWPGPPGCGRTEGEQLHRDPGR